MMASGEGTSGTESSSSPSTSLAGHASSSESTEKDFFSPSSQFPSPSTSTSTDSSPNTEQTESSLDFISEEERISWKNELIGSFNNGVKDINKQGNIGRIPDGEIEDALGLDSPLLTRQDIKQISEDQWRRPWPSFEEAERTSIYARIWALIEKHKRPDI